MESWAIFKHAVRMVFGNLGDALKVTGVLYVAMFAAQQVLVGTLLADDAAMQTAIETGSMSWGLIGLYILIASVLSIWAVIGWHRYVLLEERPTFVPKLLPANMLHYFWRTILVTLIVIIPAMIAGFFAGVIGGLLGAVFGGQGGLFGGMLGALAGFLIAMIIAYRLSPMFPAAALGNAMPFGEAWAKLRSKNKMIVMLALISAVGALILGLPSFFFDPVSIVAQAYAFVVGWVQLTIGASIVTTLYGVYVEGRELPGA